jgi:hypothetical protein
MQPAPVRKRADVRWHNLATTLAAMVAFAGILPR